jgi:prepilin-type N-terminal cleavage/methylation domain-containing protein
MNMKKIITNNLKGFTLIELMVAIAIVAILATIGFTLLQSAQAAGRDAKRRADIDAAAQAMETNWNSTKSEYPQLVDSMFTVKIPTDPLSSGTYNYYWNGRTAAPAAGATGYPDYVFCALLEKGGGNSTVSTVITQGATMNYYCKKNQQS